MTADTAGVATRQDAQGDGLTRPNAWLREMARIKPAPWLWGRAIRAALCVGLPFAAGYAFDAVITGMWIAMGTLMMTAGEPAGTYRSAARHLVLSGLVGSLGYLAGYLVGLPWAVTVAVMALCGFAGGLASSYGAILSIGSMQALLLASIAIGVPDIGPFWWLSVLYLVGAVFYIAVLGVEALIWRRRPQRQAVAGMISALAALAEARAAGAPVEDARQKVTDGLAALATIMLDTQSRNVGRSAETDGLAALVRCADALFVRLLSEEDGPALSRAGAQLAALATALSKGLSPVVPPTGGPLDVAVREVAVAASGGPDLVPPAPETQSHAEPASAPWRIDLDRLAPGSESLRAALAAGLCMGLAYAAHWWDHENHWFWIPLTVSLVMKPDLGSIFARAVLRCIGTIGGASFAALALTYLPKGLPIIMLIAALSAVLPWAMRRSYVLQALILAPLVLFLVDIIQPGTGSTDYAVQRIIDTFIGGGIVLIFGYFLWPRTHFQHLAKTFHDAKKLIGDYLLAACLPTGDADSLSEHRRRTYGSLANMRVRLRTALMEPPPASTEAAAWFPLIQGAERICDRITAYSGQPESRLSPSDETAIRQLARYIEAAPAERVGLPLPASLSDTPAVARLMDEIRAELVHMARLQMPDGFPGAPRSGASGAIPAGGDSFRASLGLSGR